MENPFRCWLGHVNRSGLWRILRCWLGHVDPMGTGVVYGESLGVG